MSSGTLTQCVSCVQASTPRQSLRSNLAGQSLPYLPTPSEAGNRWDSDREELSKQRIVVEVRLLLRVEGSCNTCWGSPDPQQSTPLHSELRTDAGARECVIKVLAECRTSQSTHRPLASNFRRDQQPNMPRLPKQQTMSSTSALRKFGLLQTARPCSHGP